MKKAKFILLAIFAVLAFAVTGLVACNNGNGGKDTTKKVYLITMDRIDNYWGRIDKGAVNAKQNYKGSVKFDYIWDGPYNKDANAQLNVIDSAVAAGADVIMLAASDAAASVSTVKAAMAKGVEFLYVDAVSNAEGFVQKLGTDNNNAGKKAGDAMLEELTNQSITSGKIGILLPDNSSTVNARKDGFKSAFGAGWTFEEVTTGDSASAANTMISNGCVAIFATNETTSIGLASAAKGKSIIAAGFDTAPAIMTAIEENVLLFAVGQNPEVMGKLAMESAIKILEGKKSEITPESVDTGCTLFFKES